MLRRCTPILCLPLLLALVDEGTALAGPYEAALYLTDVLAVGGSSRLVRVRGELPGDDLVQGDYPLQLLVRSLVDPTSYVRYDLAVQVWIGSDASLSDGLDAADVPGLLAAGEASPDGAVVFLGPDQIDVILPASFPAGQAVVQLFVDEPNGGGILLSNALPLEVPAP